MVRKSSNSHSYPKGARLHVPGLKQGETVLIPTDAPMGRALRRYLERQDRIYRKKLARKGVKL